MPIALILGVLDIVLVVHAARSGRFYPWAYVILMIPGFGALAYVLVELGPEWFGSYQGQKARKSIVRAVNPEGRYRALTDELAITDTVANREALAAEGLALGKFDEAKHHYDDILARPLGEEPIYMLGRARAEFGAGRWPMRSRPSMSCAAAGRTTSRLTDTCSMRGRSRRSGAPTRRSRNTRRWPVIFRAPRRGCATACCSTGSGSAPRPGAFSPTC